MDARSPLSRLFISRPLGSFLLLAAFALPGLARAQEVVAVPAAVLSHAEGAVAVGAAGDREWHDVRPRRALRQGDRLWTDPGARAELQAAGHILRLDGRTRLAIVEAGEQATRLSLLQGTLAASVGRLRPGDRFELGTPQLALRTAGPADFRVDVDPGKDTTRVQVLAGTAVVYGEDGSEQELRAGQQATFRERRLARLPAAAFAPAADAFDRWVAARRQPAADVASRPPEPAAAPAAPARKVEPPVRKAAAPAAKPSAPVRAEAVARAPTRTAQAAPARPLAKPPAPSAIAQQAARPALRPPRAAPMTAAQGHPGNVPSVASGQAYAGAPSAAARREARAADDAGREAERQKALADQWRREHEAWMRQQQAEPAQPVRPPPMGLPARRIS